jgi:plasmid stabilization system protein ParE
VNVALTMSALAELLQASAYIGRHDADAAVRFRERVGSALERVTAFPDAGERLPELPGQPYRQVVAAPYRIIYWREGDTIVVVSFWHQSRSEWPGADDAD